MTTLRIISKVRRRYWDLHPLNRPNPACPTSIVGLFEPTELVDLAAAGVWPLPPALVAKIASPPSRRKHRKLSRAVDATLAELLATKAWAMRQLLFNDRSDT